MLHGLKTPAGSITVTLAILEAVGAGSRITCRTRTTPSHLPRTVNPAPQEKWQTQT